MTNENGKLEWQMRITSENDKLEWQIGMTN